MNVFTKGWTALEEELHNCKVRTAKRARFSNPIEVSQPQQDARCVSHAASQGPCSLGASTGDQTLNSGEHSNSEARYKQPTSAAGRLKYSLPFWQTVLKADKHILQVLEEGYRIPFVSRPPPFHAKNNRSASQEPGFVKDAILDLLKKEYAEQLHSMPYCCNRGAWF